MSPPLPKELTLMCPVRKRKNLKDPAWKTGNSNSLYFSGKLFSPRPPRGFLFMPYPHSKTHPFSLSVHSGSSKESGRFLLGLFHNGVSLYSKSDQNEQG